MKGIIFTEFLYLVERHWGVEMIDDLIDAVHPASGGAYTSVGTYDYNELVAYVGELSLRTGIQASGLVFTFGIFLAQQFVAKFPDFFAEAPQLFDLLKKIDNHIHVEVRKLYPDAELPEFRYQQPDANTLILHYHSRRNLADLAHGLIQACADYYRQNVSIERQQPDADSVDEIFTIRLLPTEAQ